MLMKAESAEIAIIVARSCVKLHNSDWFSPGSLNQLEEPYYKFHNYIVFRKLRQSSVVTHFEFGQ